MKDFLIAVLMMLAVNASAQTEVPDTSNLNVAADKSAATLRLEMPEMTPQISSPATGTLLPYASSSAPKTTRYVPTMDMSIPAYRPPGVFGLWKGAMLGVTGSQSALPGLMDISSGALTFHQDYGRFHFTAVGMANKYWMPGISSPTGMPMLNTQYGFGGEVSYDVGKALTLHAFGTYYATNPMMGTAASSYLNSTNYGGYADIRFSDRFGSDVGVHRYLSPMTGKWVTDPIVKPYIKLNNKQKIGIDFGHLLKGLIWGNQEDMLPRGPVRMLPPDAQPRR